LNLVFVKASRHAVVQLGIRLIYTAVAVPNGRAGMMCSKLRNFVYQVF